jgi:6-phosphogluconolactonase
LVGHQSLGQSPSSLTVDPSGEFLFVAQQSSRNLASFRLDPVTGAPTPLGTVPVAGAPLSILAVRPSVD